MKHLNLLSILLAVVIFSCNKDDDMPEDDSTAFYAEINYSLAGNSVNGAFNIITNSQYSDGVHSPSSRAIASRGLPLLLYNTISSQSKY